MIGRDIDRIGRDREDENSAKLVWFRLAADTDGR